MNQIFLKRTLIAAGVMAAAGLATAQTSDVPTQAGEASTMTGGAPNAKTTNSPYTDNGVFVVQGTPQVTTRTYVYQSPVYTYTYPYTVGVPIVSTAPVVTHYGVPVTTYSYVTPHGSASATSNVPDRAGELSTITGGAPNVVTNNNVVVGSGFVPYYDPYRGVYLY